MSLMEAHFPVHTAATSGGNASGSGCLRKRSSSGGAGVSVTALAQSTAGPSSSAASLILRHRLLNRSCYGAMAQCAVAGSLLYSTNGGSSMSSNLLSQSVTRSRSYSAHRSLSATAMTLALPVSTKKFTNALTSQCRTLSSRSDMLRPEAKPTTNTNNNHRLTELLFATCLGLATTATMAYNWYDNSGPGEAESTTASESNARFSVTRRTPGSCIATATAAAPSAIQGRATKKPYDISVRAIRGGRFTMEDEYFVGNGGRFAAVFDGHGGSGVSAFLKATLYDTVNEFLRQKHWEVDDAIIEQHTSNNNDKKDDPNCDHQSNSAQVMANAVVKTMQDDQKYLQESACIPSVASHVAALRAGFEKIEQDVIANDELAFQGSTAVAVIVHESEDGSRTILSANVGDSRAILSRNGKAVDLTRDHKPNDEREKKRILAMGETIEWDAECMVHRVRNLSLARAIGDRYAKPAVSAEVEIKHFPVCEGDDEFVVLASDGLWDVMTSQDVVTFVHDYVEHAVSRMSKDNAENYRLVLRKKMAKLLAREAIRKGSTDNICVLMVWL